MCLQVLDAFSILTGLFKTFDNEETLFPSSSLASFHYCNYFCESDRIPDQYRTNKIARAMRVCGAGSAKKCLLTKMGSVWSGFWKEMRAPAWYSKTAIQESEITTVQGCRSQEEE